MWPPDIIKRRSIDWRKLEKATRKKRPNGKNGATRDCPLFTRKTALLAVAIGLGMVGSGG